MKSPQSFHRRSAYTLTEILVVIGVICILASLSFAVFRAASKTADKYDAIAKTAQDHLAAPNASSKRVATKSLLTPGKPKLPSQTKTNVPSAVPDEYIVTFTPEVADARAEAQRLATRYGGSVLSVYARMLNGCALKIPNSQFATFRADPAIATVDKHVPFGLVPDGLSKYELGRRDTRKRECTPNPGGCLLLAKRAQEVTVIAPGVDIRSTFPGATYGLNSGTSMAAPHVAGYCALLLDPTTIFGKNNRNLFFPFSPGAPPSMAAYLRSIATERIKGINGDPLSYPMVNFRVQ